MAISKDLLFNDTPTPLLRLEVSARQKYHTNSQTASIVIMAGAGNMFDEKITRYLNVNASAITRHTICVYRAAVPNCL